MQQVRETQKKETRLRLIEAARVEFDTVGYSNATLRAIAKRADVSTGAIFASFKNKEELLAEVQIITLRKIGDTMHATVIEDEPLISAILKRTKAAVDFEIKDISNSLSRIAASYSWSMDYEKRYLKAIQHPLEAARAPFEQAVAAGELPAKAPIDTAVELLFTLYLRTLRRARLYKETSDEIVERMRPSIELIVAGLKA